MAAGLGKPVVIENISGAGGNIACDKVAKSAPDGYTLVMCGNGSLVAGAEPLRQTAVRSRSRTSRRSRRSSSHRTFWSFIPDVPVKSVAELVALAKAKPGELTYGNVGTGTSQHLAAELFKAMAQVDIRSVPYRGTTALVPDLLAGRISVGFANIVNMLPLVKDGKLRPIAVTSRKRSSLVPELPTLAESGFPGYEAVPWFGLMAPAGTPQPIIDRLHAEAVKALAVPEVRRSLEDPGPRGGRRHARRIHRRDEEGDALLGEGDQGGGDQGERLMRCNAHQRSRVRTSCWMGTGEATMPDSFAVR